MSTLLATALLAALLGVPVKGASAGANTPMGAVIDDVQLPSVAGGKVSIAGAEPANVLFFFKPDQHTFAGTLKLIADCEKELGGKKVRWVAVVPARYSVAEAKAAAQEAGLDMPVVIDEGDALHNRVGIAMHPTVAVLDQQHRLVQFQPFTKLNFCEAVMARIRRVLGELDDAGLARALDPSAAQPTGGVSAARRDVKLAEMLLKSGNLIKALEFARKGVQNDPNNAAAHALLGRVLAAQGNCSDARAEFDTSLKLDASDPQALAGKKACAGKN